MDTLIGVAACFVVFVGAWLALWYCLTKAYFAYQRGGRIKPKPKRSERLPQGAVRIATDDEMNAMNIERPFGEG